MTDEIRERVCTVMSEVMNIDISAADHLYRSETEQWDSLKHLELILALEEEFQVRFSADQAANIHSLDNIIALLGGKE